MRAILFLFLCLATSVTLGQTAKKPGSQTSTIDIKGSNNNIVKVIQAGVVVTYDLASDQQAHKLLGYLRSVPAISKQLDQIEQGIKQIGQVEKNQNKLLIDIASNTAKNGFISLETYNQGLEKYVKDNNSLRGEIALYKATYQDTEFAAVLGKAEGKLRQLDNEGYQQLLEEFKEKRKAKVEQEKKELAQAAYLQAQNSQNNFQYDKALQQVEEAIKYDGNNPEYLLLKGEVLTSMYHIQEALDTYLKINYNLLDDTLKGRISHNIGLTYFSKGEYDKALENYNKALSIQLTVLREMHPDVAASYNSIGNVYLRKQAYDKALENYNEALNTRLKVLGEEHRDVAASYNNLGNIYLRKQEYVQALENYNKALSIQFKILGQGHPDMAATYNNIGAVYADKGDYTRALENYYKALNIRLKVFGEEDPDVAGFYNNIGNVHSRKRDYKRSLENYNIALVIRLKILGEQHPDTQATMRMINETKNDQKQ